MKITIKYKFESMNSYIGKCRNNYHLANNVKQKETNLAMQYFANIPKITKFPIEITFNWYMKSKIADLDGRFGKNIIDGLVRAKKIPDDNVKYIQRIVHNYKESKEDYVEVEIREIQ